MRVERKARLRIGRVNLNGRKPRPLKSARQGVLALWSGAWATLVGGVLFEGMRFGLFGWLQRQGRLVGCDRNVASATPAVRGAGARSAHPTAPR